MTEPKLQDKPFQIASVRSGKHVNDDVRWV
jgi:hypothetical protein